MKYDSQSGIITISAREFVSTARRGIASSLPQNEAEPIINNAPRKSKVELTLSFEAGGISFLLIASADMAKDGSVALTVPTDSSPKRPRREIVAQARGEGFICALALAEREKLSSVEIRFLYTNHDTGEGNEVCERVSVKKLNSFFEKCLISVSVYAEPEIERVTKRLPSMKKVKFPYGKPRSGQNEMIRAVYKNIARGGTLFTQAPTGTGKTVSVLFPAVRALGGEMCEKVFYFTPKTTTATAARDCILDLCKSGADIRACIISAKERACKNKLICREDRDKCENTKKNKLSDATLALYKKNISVATIDEIGEVAREYRICPYELSLSYSELCDIIICDLNYLFDNEVYIRRFFDNPGNYAFLIDEAHNLADRARDMYSAEITEEDIVSPAIDDIFGEHSAIKEAARGATDSFYEYLTPYIKEELIRGEDGQLVGAVHLSEVPTPLYDLFDALLMKCEDEIYKNYSADDNEKKARERALFDYYYKIKKFRTCMGEFDNSYEFFIFSEGNKLRVKCYLLDPAKQISRRLERGRSATFFSGTLSPMYYYKAVLGGDGSSDTLAVESPFESSQLSVSIMDKISTRLSEREETLLAVCRVIAATVSAKRGNYMIFTPSFAYAESLARVFCAKYPKIRTLVQKRDMTAKEKAEFLDAFREVGDPSYLIGFCVMGGIFSEGVDLVGDSLIGAIIVGIGIPSLSYEREALCAYYNEKYEEGKQFAYIYPGMNRVLQAAGRVIRGEEDKGVIVLIDDRFDDPIYRKVIPNLWRGMKFISSPKELRQNLDEFWRGSEDE